MGFKQSKCLKEKLGQEIVVKSSASSTTATTIASCSPKRKSKKKMAPASPSSKKQTNNLVDDDDDDDGRQTADNNRVGENLMANFDRKRAKPSGPTYPELFENEDRSDVTFLVGVDGWRFPGHKHVLAPASPVFRAMLNGPLSPASSTNEEIPIEDVDPRAFENILRFVYVGEVKLLTIQSALDTLYATDKYMLPELTRLCLEVLECSLGVGNVLAIHQGIRLYCSVWASSSSNRRHDEDSKGGGGGGGGKDTPRHYVPLMHTLQNRCLEIIDGHAERVLVCDDFADLSLAEVSEIVFRDTLQVNGERSVFEALHRWAVQQCKRNQMAMTWSNKRECLAGAIYAVRYLLMTKDEFLAGPWSTELLPIGERDWLLRRINGDRRMLDQLPAPPGELADRLTYLERRRATPRPVATVMPSTRDEDGRRRDAARRAADDDDDEDTLANRPEPLVPSAPPYVDPWCDTDRKRSSNSKNRCCCCRYCCCCCCKPSKLFTQCFVCFSLFFD